jgi:hypothetical protein
MMQAQPPYPRATADAHPLTLATFSLWFGLAFALANLLYGTLNDVAATECLWGMIHVMRAMFAGLLLASLLALRRREPAGSLATLRPLLINLLTLLAVLA